MTAGNDVRPVTASGSVRPSDVQHHRNLRQAELEYDDLQRRQARTTVLEEIEDFEHKLGWRMRTNLGPRWEEKRYLELEEERTKLLDEGFGKWTAGAFAKFKQASAACGRDDIKGIHERLFDRFKKTEEEV